MAEMDERLQAAAKKKAAETAATMPKVNPNTGQLSNIFTGKFGVFEVLIDDPVYGEELRAIKAALEAGNTTLADDLWNRSKWGRLDSDAQQAYLMRLENSDLYKERLKSWMISIKRALTERGLEADDKTLEDYYIRGIDDLTIIDELTSGLTIGKGALGGQAGNALEILRQTATANGFNLEKDFGNQVDGWLQQIARGEDISTIQRLIRAQAKLGLPEKVGSLLDQGLDLANVFAPYRRQMSNLLEVNEDAIDLNDPLLRSAYGPDKEMSLYDFRRAVRQDPRWQYTDNAREETSSVALKVLRDFGFQG